MKRSMSYAFSSYMMAATAFTFAHYYQNEGWGLGYLILIFPSVLISWISEDAK